LKPRLLIATGNRKKLEELRALLQGVPFEILCPADIGLKQDTAETGDTFEENARLKAVSLASQSGLLTLADDSGLEVEALGGQPGVMSARYAGENASDSQRVDYLLSKLADVPFEKRGARFRCVIAIASPQGNVQLCSGECRGYIAFQPKGQNGFGYDPVFFIPELGCTMAELPPEKKHEISHRGQAIRKARALLLKMLDEGIV
jgi:XTP/dITP diphosphohydrolase